MLSLIGVLLADDHSSKTYSLLRVGKRQTVDECALRRSTLLRHLVRSWEHYHIYGTAYLSNMVQDEQQRYGQTDKSNETSVMSQHICSQNGLGGEVARFSWRVTT